MVDFVKAFTFTISQQESFRGDTTVLTVSDWRELSACRDSDPDLFFPTGTTGLATDKIRHSVAICSACAMQEECLQYALETNQEAGVWGGYAEDDRRRLRKRWLAERRRQRQAAS
jgi:WhiB family redox-sensing transcriptional regulator